MNNSVKTAVFGVIALAGALAATPAAADRVSVGLGIGDGAGNFFSFGLNSGGRGRGAGDHGHRDGYGHGYAVPPCYPRVVYAPRPVVYVAPQAVYVPAPPPVVVPAGYWQEREERTWIEGCWVETFDAYGRRCKLWQPGRWELRRIREWVQQ